MEGKIWLCKIQIKEEKIKSFVCSCRGLCHCVGRRAANRDRLACVQQQNDDPRVSRHQNHTIHFQKCAPNLLALFLSLLLVIAAAAVMLRNGSSAFKHSKMHPTAETKNRVSRNSKPEVSHTKSGMDAELDKGQYWIYTLVPFCCRPPSLVSL